MLWRELAARLAREIADGRWAEGEAMPGVRGLAIEAGCSPATAARAYTALRDAGVLLGTPRARFVVASHGAAAAWGAGTGFATGAAAAGTRFGAPAAGAHAASGALRLAGSDDPALDLLIREAGASVAVAPGARGSLQGLVQLSRGMADAAALHLLDPASGRWNESFARGALAGRPPRLVHLWRRDQGLVVQRGNPKGVRGVEDLAGHRVAWRPEGTGSRLLLERLILLGGVRPRPELGLVAESHLAVAAAVAAGAADAGLAVRSVAEALELDWIPVVTESFELAMAPETTPAAEPLLDVLARSTLQSRLADLPGYDLAMSGETRIAE